MSIIPSAGQIKKNFLQDVSVRGWRGEGLPSGGKMEYKGAQKEFFDYAVSLVVKCDKERHRAIAQIKTRSNVLHRGNLARKIFRDAMGLAVFPERTPLRPKVRFAFDLGHSKVYHVIFQSRPKFYITGLLYLPNTVKPPFAAVLHVCGHAPDGKSFYQKTPSNLASKGLAVFNIDPIGQGERDEYVDIATGRRTVCRTCPQHAVSGDPAYLLGKNFGGYRLWDCMRAVDYLQTRHDILPNRIGVTGTSGGGWESLWLGALDPRIAAVNSNCNLTTSRRRIENRSADAESDPEQDPFGILANGLDAADLITACIPRPVSFGMAAHDFFPLDGALACIQEAGRMYKLAGVPERIAYTIGNCGHGLTVEMREQTYGWMLRWLRDQPQPDAAEAVEFIPVPEPETFATKTGIVLTSLGGKTSAQLSAEAARELALERQAWRNRTQPAARGRAVRMHLARLLRYQPPQGPIRFHTEPACQMGELTVSPVKIRSDGGLWLSGTLWQGPVASRRPATIFLTPKSKDYNPLANCTCHELARAGETVLDLDMRGMGPYDEVWGGFVPLIQANLSYHFFLLGLPMQGFHVADVVRGVLALRGLETVDPARVSVHGVEYGALIALFAACLDRRIAAVTEEKSLTSYSSLVWHRDYNWTVNSVLPEVLLHMDLEDVRSSLAPRPLKIISPLDHLKQPLVPVVALKEFAAVAQTYRALKAEAAFVIRS